MFRKEFPDAYTTSGTKFFKDTVGMSISYPKFRNFLVGMKDILKYELKNLDGDDQPHGYINKIKQLFTINKRLSVNSIIVKPKDAACLAIQDASAKSHPGYKFNELSQLTNGFVGSICDTNYSNSLYFFKDRIVNSLASIPLECAPVGPITVTITPSMGAVNTSLQNNTLVFSPTIPAGRNVKIQYTCSQN